jgi:hypothetical protein
LTILFDRELHEYRDVQGRIIPSVTQILAYAGICDFSFVEEEIRIASMQRGTSVHWLLQLEDEGALDWRRVPIRLRPYRKAYQDWKKASGFIPDRNYIEKQFISHFGFAGTMDRYGALPPTTLYPFGSSAIVDFKTGEIPDWVRFQLAAYARTIHENHQMARNVRRIALALRSDGTYSVKEFPPQTFDYDWARFMKAKRETDAGHVEHFREA